MQIRQIVAGAKHKEMVFGDRFPLRYFTDAYGLTYRAAFPGCSSDMEPSADTIAFDRSYQTAAYFGCAAGRDEQFQSC